MAYTPNKTESETALLTSAVAEVRQGLYASTRDELAEWQANVDYYECRNRVHFPRREAESEHDYAKRPKQYARLVRKAVRELAVLYRPGPQRSYEGVSAGLSSLLDLVYAASAANAVFQAADRHATLNGSVAIQPVPTGNPNEPIRLYVWGRHEFVPYFRDDDPMRPAIVVTRSVLQCGDQFRRKYQVWTADAVQTWYTRKIDSRYDAYWAGTAADQYAADESGPHPYGVLPFAFAFNEMPVERFDGSGIGSPLREANVEMDRSLSDTAEALAVFSVPKLVGRNLSTSFRWRDRTDGIVHLPAADPDGAPPEILPVQPALDIEQTWLHLERFANLTFEHLGVPVKAVRGDHGYEESGIKVLIDRGPILDYLRERQTAWTLYEQSLFGLLLRVLGRWYGVIEATTAEDAAELTLSWPAPSFSVPTDEWDRSLQNGIDMGTESVITVIMKRDGLTEDQAIERLKRIAEHNRLVAEITGTTPPPTDPEPDANDSVNDDPEPTAVESEEDDDDESNPEPEPDDTDSDD